MKLIIMEMARNPGNEEVAPEPDIDEKQLSTQNPKGLWLMDIYQRVW